MIERRIRALRWIASIVVLGTLAGSGLLIPPAFHIDRHDDGPGSLFFMLRVCLLVTAGACMVHGSLGSRIFARWVTAASLFTLIAMMFGRDHRPGDRLQSLVASVVGLAICGSFAGLLGLLSGPVDARGKRWKRARLAADVGLATIAFIVVAGVLALAMIAVVVLLFAWLHLGSGGQLSG